MYQYMGYVIRAARALCRRILEKTYGPCGHFRIGYIQNRNAQTEEKDHYPEDILNTNDAVTLAKSLLLFIMEVCKKKDGTE